MVASQGGPREHLARFRAIGTKWLHVVASVEHAQKAEAAGVDALVVDGGEAGGHPPPSEVSTLVLVRRVVRSTKLPVVASGGVADGAGIAALLALGADAVQLGTRFIATPEASVHENYKRAVLEAEVDQTAFVGRGMAPIRQLKNSFAEQYAALERSRATSSGARWKPGRARAWCTKSCRRRKSCGSSSSNWRRRDGAWRTYDPADRRQGPGAGPDAEPSGKTQRARHGAHWRAARIAAHRGCGGEHPLCRAHRRGLRILRRRGPERVQGPHGPQGGRDASRAHHAAPPRLLENDHACRHRDQRRRDGRRRRPRH